MPKTDAQPTRQFTFRLKDETREVLEELAATDRRTLTNYVNYVLDQHAAANAKVIPMRRRK
jgi:uncharacterized protein (DUF1778 family)